MAGKLLLDQSSVDTPSPASNHQQHPSDNHDAPLSAGRSTPSSHCPTQLGELREADPDSIAAMVFLAMILLTAGILSIYIQCRRLQGVLRKRKKLHQQRRAVSTSLSSSSSPSSIRRNRDRHDTSNNVDLQLARQSRRRAHISSFEALKAETKNLREVQQSVRAQVWGLEQLLVATKAAAAADGASARNRKEKEGGSPSQGEAILRHRSRTGTVT